MTPLTPSGRVALPLLAAGMGSNMPFLVAEEAGAPRSILREQDRFCALKSGRQHLFLLAPGDLTHRHGLSARGADHLPGSPRCTQFGCDELCQEPPHDIADGLPGPVGVEVVISASEVSHLHAPSIRMESEHVARESA